MLMQAAFCVFLPRAYLMLYEGQEILLTIFLIVLLCVL